MFCSAVSDGTRLKDWKTKPMRSRRKLAERVLVQARRDLDVAEVDRPAVGRSRPAAQCRNVLLPDPDGPITAVNDPRANPKETSRRAATLLPPLPYILLTDDSRTLSVAARV